MAVLTTYFPDRQRLPNAETPWHVSPEVFQRLRHEEGKNYKACQIFQTDREWDFVHQYFNMSNTTGKQIGRITCIHNPALSKAFEANLSTSEIGKDGQAFEVKWKQRTPTGSPEHNRRSWALQRWEDKAKDFSPFYITNPKGRDKFEKVKIFPLWHGTKESKVESIKRAGWVSFGKAGNIGTGPGCSTDDGWFGDGIYFTDSAHYALDSAYSDGHLFLVWVSMREPFPVITEKKYHHQFTDTAHRTDAPEDMRKLKGVKTLDAHDANYIPVKRLYSGVDAICYPCFPDIGETPAWDEFAVVGEPQILGRFLVQLDSLLKLTPSGQATTIRIDLLARLLTGLFLPSQPDQFTQDFIGILDSLNPGVSSDIICRGTDAIQQDVRHMMLNVIAKIDKSQIRDHLRLHLDQEDPAILTQLKDRVSVLSKGVRGLASLYEQEGTVQAQFSNESSALTQFRDSTQMGKSSEVLDAISHTLNEIIYEKQIEEERNKHTQDLQNAQTKHTQDLQAEKRKYIAEKTELEKELKTQKDSATKQTQDLQEEKAKHKSEKTELERELKTQKDSVTKSSLAIEELKRILEQERLDRQAEIQRLQAITEQHQLSGIAGSTTTLGQHQEPIDVVALKRRIDSMSFKENHKSAEFRKAATYRLSIFEGVFSSLDNFQGLFEDGNIFLMTGRKTTFVASNGGKSLDISQLQAITDVFKTRPGVMDQVLNTAYDSIVYKMRLWKAPEGGYCDIIRRGVSDDLMRNQLVMWSELEALSQNMHIHLHGLFDRLDLTLIPPQNQADQSIDWNKTEDGRSFPKTFEAKLIEIVSRAIALKWVQQNNETLTQYLGVIERSA